MNGTGAGRQERGAVGEPAAPCPVFWLLAGVNVSVGAALDRAG